MLLRMFERGQLVMVRLRAREEPVEAEVVLDLGEDTLIVDPCGDPATMRRVPRRAVANGVHREPPKPKKKPVVKPKPAIDMAKLSCMETGHGWCATQTQTRSLTRAEVIEGVWTICCTWAESRSVPSRREPTCPRCREELKMEPLDVST